LWSPRCALERSRNLCSVRMLDPSTLPAAGCRLLSRCWPQLAGRLRPERTADPSLPGRAADLPTVSNRGTHQQLWLTFSARPGRFFASNSLPADPKNPVWHNRDSPYCGRYSDRPRRTPVASTLHMRKPGRHPRVAGSHWRLQAAGPASGFRSSQVIAVFLMRP